MIQKYPKRCLYFTLHNLSHLKKKEKEKEKSKLQNTQIELNTYSIS